LLEVLHFRSGPPVKARTPKREIPVKARTPKREIPVITEAGLFAGGMFFLLNH